VTLRRDLHLLQTLLHRTAGRGRPGIVVVISSIAVGTFILYAVDHFASAMFINASGC
jgi:hypothetical protein